MDIIINDIEIIRFCIECGVFETAIEKSNNIWISQLCCIDPDNQLYQKFQNKIENKIINIYGFEQDDITEILKIYWQHQDALTLSEASCFYMFKKMKSSAFIHRADDTKLKELCSMNEIEIYNHEWFLKNIIGNVVFEKKNQIA